MRHTLVAQSLEITKVSDEFSGDDALRQAIVRHESCVQLAGELANGASEAGEIVLRDDRVWRQVLANPRAQRAAVIVREAMLEFHDERELPACASVSAVTDKSAGNRVAERWLARARPIHRMPCASPTPPMHASSALTGRR